MMMMGPGYFWCSGMWVFPILMFIIMLIAIFIFRRSRIISSRCDNNRDETAMEILKKRYAQGEISKEEFQEIKKDISKE